MNLLLTGKNGQVGFELQRSLSLIGHVKAVDVADCDLADGEALRRLVREFRPDIIVNPAAYTAVDKAESDAKTAHAINAVAPQILAEEAERLGAMLVHFSTDYVFDGKKSTPYTEQDEPNPQSVYGQTKWEGEEAVRNNCSRHLIFRTSWVVGAHGGNFAKTILRLAQERDRLQVVADQCGAPTSAAWLADLSALLIDRACRMPEGFPYGLYHAVASGQTNWHEYARFVIENARQRGVSIKVAADNILPIATKDYPTPAKRPANSQLSTMHLQQTFGVCAPDWQFGLSQVLDYILQ